MTGHGADINRPASAVDRATAAERSTVPGADLDQHAAPAEQTIPDACIFRFRLPRIQPDCRRLFEMLSRLGVNLMNLNIGH